MVYNWGKSCAHHFHDSRGTGGNENRIFHHWLPLLCCSFQLESVFNRISRDGASMFIVCIVLKSIVWRMRPCKYEGVTQRNTRVSICTKRLTGSCNFSSCPLLEKREIVIALFPPSHPHFLLTLLIIIWATFWDGTCKILRIRVDDDGIEVYCKRTHTEPNKINQ